MISLARAWRVALAILPLAFATPVGAEPFFAAREPAYRFITPRAEAAPVVLTGRSLSIEQLLSIARGGAQVSLSQEARDRSADAYGLLLQGAAEGVSIYWFNRGTGDQRESVIFSGDPTSPENARFLRERQARFFAEAPRAFGPEIRDEALVRAVMAVRLNTMSFEAASPQLTQMLLDLLNRRVTPVLNSRGTVGEGDLPIMAEIGRVMVGRGEAYFRGRRMPAMEALRRAGLRPLSPTGADDAALISTNAVAAARAALLVADAREALNWADVSTAMALLAMNSSITPLSAPVQANRPFAWLNWDARRVLALVGDSYLVQTDPNRIIQDPESLRASTQRIGSAWHAWGALHDAVLMQMNSSDHNPAVCVGLQPGDSWELSTPQLMQFYVRGGPLSNGKSGYILSSANWDPYPLANEIEAFTIALANGAIIFNQRIDRFRDPFFTGVAPAEALGPARAHEFVPIPDYLPNDLSAELNAQLGAVWPRGEAIASGVEDLQAATRQKLDHAERALEIASLLISLDLSNSISWLNIRAAENPERALGASARSLLAALGEAGGAARGSGEIDYPGADVRRLMAMRSADFLFPESAPAAPSDSPLDTLGAGCARDHQDQPRSASREP